MKFATLVTLVTAVAAAQPHKHHQHLHKRGENVVTVYELDGRIISAAEVQEGISNGTLVFDKGTVASAPVLSSAAPTPSVAKAQAEIKVKPSSAPVSSAAPAPSSSAPAPSSSAAVVAAAAPSPSAKAAAAPAPVADDSSSSSPPYSMDATGVASEFPSGQVACNQFPSQYGAVPVSWMGFGGYTGIQAPETTSGGFDNIVTKTPDSCSGANCCAEGDYCSYACPPGYQKSQWPSTQGATGQSVGGLLCQNGKLQLTNPGLSKSLCMKGTTQVNVQVKNTMSSVASVCRTDYPGTESEVIPLSAGPNSITPLTCPDGNNYYMWDGKITSAQYYVNPKGVPVNEACQWGDASQPYGNFAPLNLGVGYSAGAAWLSIFQNLPTTNAKLDYTVELVGDNGGFDNFVGKCKYSNGQYCSGDNYENCSSNGAGCTVNVQHGTATFVFSD